jgi:NifU-like protein involved in Fe-S cluster formation
MIIYNELVQDHYRNPRNLGRLEGATASTRLFRGDAMLELYLRVAKDRIEAASFRVIGCAGTVAAASAITEWLVGRSLEEARTVTAQTVLEILQGLPDERLYCADFVAEGVEVIVNG